MNHTPTSGSEDPSRNAHGLHLGEDTVLDLLHGLLSPGEQEHVRGHVAECADCEALLRRRMAERERLRATWRLLAMPSGELELRRAEKVPGDGAVAGAGSRTPGTVPGTAVQSASRHPWLPWSGSYRRLGFRFAMGAIAAATMLVIIFYSPPRPIGPSPGSPGLHAVPITWDRPRLRGEVTDAGGWTLPGGDAASLHGGKLAAGLAAYADQDYPLATELLEQAEAEGTFDLLRRIYLGSALAWSGRNRAALATLGTVPTHSLPEPWGGEARWTLFVVLSRMQRRGAADSLLAVLAGESGVVGERAREYLQGR